jgi:hypothetical protein
MAIFQQNVNGVQTVEPMTIDLANLKSGRVTVYRPEPVAE